MDFSFAINRILHNSIISMKLMNTSALKRFIPLILLIGFVSLSLMTSCVQTKKIIYMQGDTSKYLSSFVPKMKPQTINSGDLVSIMVVSLDAESNVTFNFMNLSNLSISNFSNSQGLGKSQPLGYLVDSAGFVNMPLIGKILLKDLTLSAASDSIGLRLKNYLKEPTVSVRILNHKFSVLGEVNRPAVYNMVEDRTTILEALSMAGDLTIFGRRENILLIRESLDGKREMVRVNLTKREFLDSDYYYIRPNDVLYVEPLKTKATATDQNYQLVPIFTGIVSALGILILNLRN
ncbi:polysaccharide biosynthesis/export family protein [Flectobacillus major]|uniref:polysaccharide biosynthesis/export family protein n=1 Tax=Flectobacillus major TaxID=103 RepID=UPI0006934A90|nr:polysaccharide biosynthesis/export family protein [Flectobacillus major]